MLIGDALSRAFDAVSARERDVLLAYTPGATPEMHDVVLRHRPLPDADPLSVTAPDSAYFITFGERGRECFGRDGRFSLQQNGDLVDEEGRAVMGFARAGSPLAPLHASAADAALGFTKSARIGEDGSITYTRRTIDPRTGEAQIANVCIGRLALARFAPGTALTPADAQHFLAPPGIVPHTGCAGDGSFQTLTLFTREQGDVDIDRGLVRLQEAYLSLDAQRAASVARFGTQKTAMDLLK